MSLLFTRSFDHPPNESLITNYPASDSQPVCREADPLAKGSRSFEEVMPFLPWLEPTLASPTRTLSSIEAIDGF